MDKQLGKGISYTNFRRVRKVYFLHHALVPLNVIAIATLLRTFLVVCFACCQKCPCPNLCGGSYIELVLVFSARTFARFIVHKI